MPTLISSVTWVQKGVARSLPDRIKLDESQIQELIQQQDNSNDNADEGSFIDNIQVPYTSKHKEGASAMAVDEDTDELTGDRIEQLYQLDKYDDDAQSLELMGASIQGLSCYSNPSQDPYITLDNISDTSSQDFSIDPTDNLLLVGRADEEYSLVEVFVYNEFTQDQYCHHEIMLNAHPLCIELVRLEQQGESLSLVAVGTMEPEIELWDLDLVDGIEPYAVLGKRKKSSGSKKLSKKRHTKPVLCLSWNRSTSQLLASGSADKTVRVWDVSTTSCIETLLHTDTVQSVAWHPYRSSLLLTGCVDGCVRVFDCATEHKLVTTVSLSSEVEKVLWNQLQPTQIVACTESGQILCVCSELGQVLYQIAAHDKPVTDISLSAFLPGLLVSTSVDKSYKVWDLSEGGPKCLHSSKPGMGRLYCATFSPDNPYVFAIGGEKQGLTVVDLMKIGPVASLLKGRELKRVAT